MTEGIQPDIFLIEWDEAGIVDGVTQAMQLVKEREGSTGVVILGTLLPSEELLWIKRGIKLSGRPDPLVYKTGLLGEDDTAAATEVGHWLDRAGEGEENRDLVACIYVSRGWEARTVVVLDRGILAENLGLRAVSRLVVVKKK